MIYYYDLNYYFSTQGRIQDLSESVKGGANVPPLPLYPPLSLLPCLGLDTFGIFFKPFVNHGHP